MNYNYKTLLQIFTAVLLSLSFLAPVHATALVSDIAPTGSATEDSCTDLSISFGYRANDQGTSGSVSRLQDFLISKNYLQSESTGYFGGLTLKAVKAYQTAKGFGATGYVGNYTRAAVKSDSCSTGSQSTGETSMSITSTGGSSVSNNGGGVYTGSTVAGVVKGRVLNDQGKASTLAFLKCGNRASGDYVAYSPNQTGDVSFNTEVCRQKGGTVWVSCPIGQVASLTSIAVAEFNGATVVCSSSADVSSASVATSVGNCTLDTKVCSGGALVSRVAPTCQFAACPGVVATSVSGGVNGSGSSALCPDGTVRPLVVVGPSTGCEGHELTFLLRTSNSLTGTFVVNGDVYNTMPVYNRLTGVNRNTPPKLCIQLPGNTNCSVASGYREVAPTEWFDNTTVQTIVQDPSIYPAVTYSTYIMYPNGSPIKTGYFALKLPGTGTGTGTGTSSTCPDGTVRPLVVVGPSTGCEGHMSPVGSSGSSSFCPDGTARATFVVGPSTGCEGHETKPLTTSGSIVMTVANSQSGPFVANGNVYNNLSVRTRTTGLQRSASPKGCMQKAGDTACRLSSSFRDFTQAEWRDATTVETVVQDPSGYPLTTYEGYIMYPGGSPIKTGAFNLIAAPVAATQPVSITCAGPGACGGPREIGGYSWRVYVNLLGTGTWLGLEALGIPTPAETCNASIVDQQRTVIKDGTNQTIKCEAWYK